MPEQYFVLDENDRQLFIWMLDEERNRNRGSVPPANQTPEVRQTQSPECYVALTPSGGIPARSGTTPGTANCNIYQLKLNQSTNQVELVAIPQFVQKVYNVSGRAAPANIYFVLRREKYGVFVYECPCTT